ncbi:MAG: hypothetical protein E7G06_06310, partial [Bifidobacterium longum]|nr:hypothetical protein [Bifidobacterium longum]
MRFIKAPPWSESTGAKGMLSHPHLFHTRKSLRGNQKQSKNVSKERMMSATEVVANMPLHSATVRVNKHKADWRGWKFMWPFALVFVFVFIVPIVYAVYISFFKKQMIGGTKFVGF